MLGQSALGSLLFNEIEAPCKCKSSACVAVIAMADTGAAAEEDTLVNDEARTRCTPTTNYVAGQIHEIRHKFLLLYVHSPIAIRCSPL